MREKSKRRPQPGMSRRQFLQLSIATGAITTGAGIFALWDNTSEQVVHYSFSWVRPDVLRLNQASSDLLRKTLSLDGFFPAEIKVYDRAMEYKTGFSAKGELISRELLFRDNESAQIVFTVDKDTMSDEAQASLTQNLSEILAHNQNFRVQNIEVIFQ